MVSFIAGLSAPIFAVCVLPLYPGFLSFLASRIQKKGKKSQDSQKIIILGIIVTLGVIVSMFIFGLIFTFFLQESLTKAIGIVSPIAFTVLALISILLIFNYDLGKFLPKINAPIKKNSIN